MLRCPSWPANLQKDASGNGTWFLSATPAVRPAKRKFHGPPGPSTAPSLLDGAVSPVIRRVLRLNVRYAQNQLNITDIRFRKPTRSAT